MSPDMFSPQYFKQLAYQNVLHDSQAMDFHGWAKLQVPTMLRYWKLASDISWLFGDLNGKDVIEIGAAWGTHSCCSPRGGLAQALLTRFPHLGSYTFVDHESVERSAEQDLLTVRPWDEDKVRMWSKLPTAERNGRDAQVDLCVSDYAFSELHRELALEYAATLLPACRAGFFVWNSLM